MSDISRRPMTPEQYRIAFEAVEAETVPHRAQLLRLLSMMNEPRPAVFLHADGLVEIAEPVLSETAQKALALYREIHRKAWARQGVEVAQ